MTPDQMKAARLLLGWSIDRLAVYSDTSIHVVRTFEQTGTVVSIRDRDRRVPIDAVATIRATLEEAGIEFTNSDEPEVKLRKPDP